MKLYKYDATNSTYAENTDNCIQFDTSKNLEYQGNFCNGTYRYEISSGPFVVDSANFTVYINPKCDDFFGVPTIPNLEETFSHHS